MKDGSSRPRSSEGRLAFFCVAAEVSVVCGAVAGPAVSPGFSVAVRSAVFIGSAEVDPSPDAAGAGDVSETDGCVGAVGFSGDAAFFVSVARTGAVEAVGSAAFEGAGASDFTGVEAVIGADGFTAASAFGTAAELVLSGDEATFFANSGFASYLRRV